MEGPLRNPHSVHGRAGTGDRTPKGCRTVMCLRRWIWRRKRPCNDSKPQPLPSPKAETGIAGALNIFHQRSTPNSTFGTPHNRPSSKTAKRPNHFQHIPLSSPEPVFLSPAVLRSKQHRVQPTLIVSLPSSPEVTISMCS